MVAYCCYFIRASDALIVTHALSSGPLRKRKHCPSNPDPVKAWMAGHTSVLKVLKREKHVSEWMEGGISLPSQQMERLRPRKEGNWPEGLLASRWSVIRG